jgi:hypothetical protein
MPIVKIVANMPSLPQIAAGQSIAASNSIAQLLQEHQS